MDTAEKTRSVLGSYKEEYPHSTPIDRDKIVKSLHRVGLTNHRAWPNAPWTLSASELFQCNMASAGQPAVSFRPSYDSTRPSAAPSNPFERSTPNLSVTRSLQGSFERPEEIDDHFNPFKQASGLDQNTFPTDRDVNLEKYGLNKGPTSHSIAPISAGSSFGDALSGTPRTNGSQNPSSDYQSLPTTPSRRNFSNYPDNSSSSECSKVSSDSFNASPAREVASQTKTFADLALAKGIRNWNNISIDDRWSFRPEEDHKAQTSDPPTEAGLACSDFALTSSPDKYRPKDNQGLARDEQTAWPSGNGHNFRASGSAGSSSHRNLEVHNVLDTDAESGLIYRPPPEAERLQKLAQEITRGECLEMPVNPESARAFFLQRCFGRHGPLPLSSDDRIKLTRFLDELMTFAELRTQILQAIDGLVSYLFTDVNTAETGLTTHDDGLPIAQNKNSGLRNPAFDFEAVEQSLPMTTQPLRASAPAYSPPKDHQQRHYIQSTSGPYNRHVTREDSDLPGLCTPLDRHVRPPAATRLAPLFAGSDTLNSPGRYAHTMKVADVNTTKMRLMSTSPDTRTLAYHENSDAMYPQPAYAGAQSIKYQILTQSNPPPLHLLTSPEYLPFEQTSNVSKPAEWGVMKIGNIPYDVSQASIRTFLGAHAKLLSNDFGPAIHIVMDRATGKTQDCYVEFFSRPDAQAWVNVIAQRNNSANRLGERILHAQMSSQDELLKELFPRAKNVVWSQGMPVIIPSSSDDPYNSGFKTFVTAEELQSLVRHAEQPHRSNYTLKCPHRPYEALISLLSKFPWHATPYYTLDTRDRIYDASKRMLTLLLRRPTDPTRGQGLARDLLRAALNASGFSERQKAELAGMTATAIIGTGMRISPQAQSWPFIALHRRRHVDEDVVRLYLGLLVGPVAPINGVNSMAEAEQTEWNLLVAALHRVHSYSHSHMLVH